MLIPASDADRSKSPISNTGTCFTSRIEVLSFYVIIHQSPGKISESSVGDAALNHCPLEVCNSSSDFGKKTLGSTYLDGVGMLAVQRILNPSPFLLPTWLAFLC